MPVKILVVDDETDIVELISYNLEKEGITVLKSFNGEEALHITETQKPDLILLDLMLPGIQGMEVARKIRSSPGLSHIPIIMLTAKGEEIEKILGLEIGADDYVTKPFSVRELIARIRAVLRRYNRVEEEEAHKYFTYKNLTIDYSSYTVSIDGNRVNLSPTEFKLLKFLSQHPGRVYTRNQLLDYVWGDDAFVEPRTVDVHIKRLRAQIEADISNPALIETVRGIGYKFTEIE